MELLEPHNKSYDVVELAVVQFLDLGHVLTFQAAVPLWHLYT
jgi:hypothetical protein